MIRKTTLVVSLVLALILIVVCLGLMDPYAHPKVFTALCFIFGLMSGAFLLTPFFLDIRRKGFKK